MARTKLLANSYFVMALSNGVTLSIAIAAYLIYSKILSVGEYGFYASVVAFSKIISIVQDGGVKTVIIKSKIKYSESTYKAIYIATIALSGAMFCILMLGLRFVEFEFNVVDASLIYIIYTGSYIFAFPLTIIGLSELERGQKFKKIATIDSISNFIEFIFPMLLYLFGVNIFYGFIISVFLSKIYRVIHIGQYNFDLNNKADWGAYKKIVAEGWCIQKITIVSMLRDNQHLLIIGPIYGSVWLGNYSWALQMCAVLSQVFIQSVNRVALTKFRVYENNEESKTALFNKIKWLTICTIPLMIAAYIPIKIINESYFLGKWSDSIELMLLLFIRMVPSVATSAIAPYLLVNNKVKYFSKANFIWTILEVAVVLSLLYYVGEYALALGYACMGWVGLYILTYGVREDINTKKIFAIILVRPSIYMCAFLTAVLNLYYKNMSLELSFLCIALMLIASIATEKDVVYLLRNKKRIFE
jgi:O-antigen/teichoic acid export membrane protein